MKSPSRFSRLETDDSPEKKSPKPFSRFLGFKRKLEVDTFERESEIEVDAETLKQIKAQEMKRGLESKIRFLNESKKNHQQKMYERQAQSDILRNSRATELKLRIGWNLTWGVVKVGLGIYGLYAFYNFAQRVRASSTLYGRKVNINWSIIRPFCLLTGTFILLSLGLREFEKRREQAALAEQMAPPETTTERKIELIKEVTGLGWICNFLRLVQWSVGLAAFFVMNFGMPESSYILPSFCLCGVIAVMLLRARRILLMDDSPQKTDSFFDPFEAACRWLWFK
jgi:hypothetical protein